MKRLLLLVSITLVLGCNKAPQQTSTTTAASTTTQSASVPAPVPAPVSTTGAAPAPASMTPSAGTLASQETNWKGVLAEVTEFRRKGNTVTAKIRLTNRGSEDPQVEIKYEAVYLIDTGAGKKYNVLRDEKGEYIAATNPGWADRWYTRLKQTEAQVIWMKFPAPPAEAKAITLQLPNMPPFEDVAIQD